MTKHNPRTSDIDPTTASAVAGQTTTSTTEPKPTDPKPEARTTSTTTTGGSSSSLVSELDKLPKTPTIEAIKANAANGYYDKVSPQDLAKDLEALNPDDPQAKETVKQLAERAARGEFGGTKTAEPAPAPAPQPSST